MDWVAPLLIILGSLVIMMFAGFPIASSFFLVCMGGAYVYWGGLAGIEALISSIVSGVASFSFLPIPLFILMGTVMFESGSGLLMVDALEKWFGNVRARLSLIAVVAGILLATMTGVSTASVAVLGKGLAPKMKEKGYGNALIFGPIIGGGQLATLIPPSMLGVFLAAVGGISMSGILIGAIVPGLIMSVLFLLYILGIAKLYPALAPSYTVSRIPLSEKLRDSALYILPIGFIIFSVIGAMIMGVATPTEAAALGVVASYLLAAIQGRFTWNMLKNSVVSALETSVAIMLIIAAAVTFGRILSYSGSVSGFVSWAVTLPVPPLVLIIFTQIVVLIMGCFMGPNSILLIVLPIFMPVVNHLKFDPVLFGVMTLINVQLGLVSPPFGMDCYVMKAVCPYDVGLGEVFKGAMPFFFIGVFVSVLIMFFPQIVLWLPGLMSR